jgi:phosphatidyl-myo-inositol alpha-mannosyltransferase
VRIALAHSTYWPEVRRGSERVVHDLGVVLARRGHDVTVITSHRHRPTRSAEEGVEVVRAWRPPHLRALDRYEYHIENVPNVIYHVARGRFELVHAFFTSDGWAATRLRRTPVVFSLHGIPTRQGVVGRRHRLRMLTSTVDRAAECTLLSRAAATSFQELFGREPRVVPPGIFCDDFAVDNARSSAPTLLSASSLGDPRKRGNLLVGAFRRVRRSLPDARLVVLRGRDPVMSGPEPELPEGAEWIDPDGDARLLGRAYAGAWATVLPSVNEAFGLVLVESLAAGTPVIGARSGGIPEFVTDESIGTLFEPDDEHDLARAMEEALSRSPIPDTAAACRRHAERHDWSHAVQAYEEIYERVLSGES